MLKILAITGALLVASVSAYRQDYLDCAKHGPLTVAYKEAKAKHEANLSNDAAAQTETRTAWYAAQEAVKASLDAAAEAEKKVKEENMKAFTEPLKAGADVCVAGMQACVDADPDVDGTINANVGFLNTFGGMLQPGSGIAVTATNLEGWMAVQPGSGGEGTYVLDPYFTPKTSKDFDGWRECAEKTAAVKEACCDSFCGLYSPDMTKVVCAQGSYGGAFEFCGGKGQMTVLEMFAEEIKKVKEVLATKAADGTYTYECEAGMPWDFGYSLNTDSDGTSSPKWTARYPGARGDDDMLNVFQYINDGSYYIEDEWGQRSKSGTSPVEIPFDENAASVFSTFLEHHFHVDKIADLGNPDCEIQMGCPVSAYDACARDHYYSCNQKGKEAYGDSEIEFDWDCLDKAVLAKCEKLKTVAPTPAPPTAAPTAAPKGANTDMVVATTVEVKTLQISIDVDVDLSTLNAADFKKFADAGKAMAEAAGVPEDAIAEIKFFQEVLNADGKSKNPKELKEIEAPTGRRARRALFGPITFEIVFKDSAAVDLAVLAEAINDAIGQGNVPFTVVLSTGALTGKVNKADMVVVEVKPDGIAAPVSGSSTTAFSAGLIAMLAAVATIV